MSYSPLPPLGQTTKSASLPVTLASDTGTLDISAASLPLPSGAATAALQTQPGVDIGDVTINNASGASAVNIQDGGNSITVDGTFWQATQPVSLAAAVPVTDNSGSLTVDAPVATPVFVRLSDGTSAIATLPVSLATNTPTLQSGSTTAVTQATGTNLHTVVDSGTVTTVSTVTNLSQMAGAAISMGTGVRGAGVQRVTIATDDVVPASQSGTWTVQPGNTANTTPWLVKERTATTPGQTSPSVTTTSTSILASNANRVGGTIYNEGAAICYMKLGATASTTSYTLQIASGGYYEIPFSYTGAIDGITSAGTAQLRVTELT